MLLANGVRASASARTREGIKESASTDLMLGISIRVEVDDST